MIDITEFPTVCQEWIEDELNLDVVITGPPRTGDRAYFGIAWRSPGEPWTFCGEGEIDVFNREDLRPHPDPEQAWADYCAALLTQ